MRTLLSEREFHERYTQLSTRQREVLAELVTMRGIASVLSELSGYFAARAKAIALSAENGQVELDENQVAIHDGYDKIAGDLLAVPIPVCCCFHRWNAELRCEICGCDGAA